MQTGTLFETGITALQNHATTSSIPTVLMAAGVAFVVIMVALILLIIAGMCGVFKKAGYHRYEGLVSGHNFYTLLVLAGKPGRYIFVVAIPYVLFVLISGILYSILGETGGDTWVATHSYVLIVPLILAYLYIYADLVGSVAKRFQKGFRFKAGLFFLPFIFYPILGFGKAKYSHKH